ncbi:unnamed protein product [Rotaria sordida]|uniref:Fucosyltransferase n=1 Tax=Rotaria sordida TaxID=392033 RepID=A0A814F9J1_9BILA|nr:unnamed protein product [Rotaria sordida]
MRNELYSINLDKTHQSIKYPKYFLNFCLIIIGTTILYLLSTNSYFYNLQLVQIDWSISSNSHNNVDLISNIIKEKENMWKINLQFSQPLFQSRLSPYHPYLPIHIYTQNLSSLRNISKLILLGNEFFGDETWGLHTREKSSQEPMTHLLCPYLAHYCEITIDKKLFSQADAVVYHIRDHINKKQAEKNRRPYQRFVFVLWESPTYTPKLNSYKGFFNWTMTYRFKSHIIASYYSRNAYIHTSSDYYQFILKENAIKNLNLNFKKSDHQLSDEILANKNLGTVAALISNCGGRSGRLMFINKLKRYIDVQVYGRCGEKCPENVDCREFIAKKYYFFLSFENTLCTDYTTEKFFSTLEYPIVPVVYGRTNYSYFIPSSGFIDINDFPNVLSLAQYLKQTRDNKEKYLSYFSWKKDYVWGITQFFSPFCDLCLRLHLDSTPNVIDDMDAWWNENACQGPRKLKS